MRNNLKVVTDRRASRSDGRLCCNEMRFLNFLVVNLTLCGDGI